MREKCAKRQLVNSENSGTKQPIMKMIGARREPGEKTIVRASGGTRKSALIIQLIREFDPGSGRTLAACLTHASRAEVMSELAHTLL